MTRTITPTTLGFKPQATTDSSDFCYFCNKRVYLMERMSANGFFFHRTCFKCSHCNCQLKIGGFSLSKGSGGEKGKFFCSAHYRQLFLSNPEAINYSRAGQGGQGARGGPGGKAGGSCGGGMGGEAGGKLEGVEEEEEEEEEGEAEAKSPVKEKEKKKKKEKESKKTKSPAKEKKEQSASPARSPARGEKEKREEGPSPAARESSPASRKDASKSPVSVTIGSTDEDMTPSSSDESSGQKKKVSLRSVRVCLC